MQGYLLIILLFCFQLRDYAQEAVVYDTSSLQIRKFAWDRMNEFKANPDFEYERLREPPKSLVDRFWDWFWGKVREIVGTEEGARTLNTILILLAIIILVLFVMKLTGMTNAGLFGKDSKGKPLDYNILKEDIHTIDFERAIQDAIDTKNFRIAVRLLYLQSLKNLTDHGLINWQLNVQELENNEVQQVFRDLTFQFEINWYGDVPIDQNEFVSVKDQFNRFNRQLQ
jgi:hypothetical protein